MKKQSFHSLRFRVTLLLMVILIVFTILITYNNYSAFSLLQKRIYRNTEETLVFYQEYLDERLADMETYLFTLALNDTTLPKLKYTEMNTTGWFVNLHQLQRELQNSRQIYTVDGVFCYLPEQSQYIYASNDIRARNVRSTLEAEIEKEVLDLSEWTIREINGEYLFWRVLHVNNVYAGAWITVDTLLDTMARTDEMDSRLIFQREDGVVMQNVVEPIKLLPPAEKRNTYVYEKVEDTVMLSVSKKVNDGDFYLTMLVPKSQITDNNRTFAVVISIVASSFLLVWLVLYIALKSWVIQPMAQLTGAIGEIRKGNLKTQISVKHQLEEFQQTTVAFNEMVTEIADLKIDVYEKKIQRQRLEAEYLKQQITPHFMINCLNAVYQLTVTKHNDLARTMLRDLSYHLRYTLSSGQTVKMEEEIRLVENYVELSGIRYPESIKLILVYPEEVKNATVIPLILLTFVENTIKYEVEMGKLLEIYIEAEKIYKDGKPYLEFYIWDTGKGFSEEMLEKLQDLETYLQTETQHIGIINVVLRARHVFEESWCDFKNLPDAGAQIHIVVTWMEFESA